MVVTRRRGLDVGVLLRWWVGGLWRSGPGRTRRPTRPAGRCGDGALRAGGARACTVPDKARIIRNWERTPIIVVSSDRREWGGRPRAPRISYRRAVSWRLVVVGDRMKLLGWEAIDVAIHEPRATGRRGVQS
jgi:hypothetical protein